LIERSNLTDEEVKKLEQLITQRFGLKEIAPVWYQYIMTGNELIKKAYNLDITKADRDIVGEGHFFKRNYIGCLECQLIGNAFSRDYIQHINEPNSEISIDPELLKRFEDHWNGRGDHREKTALKIIERERNKKHGK